MAVRLPCQAHVIDFVIALSFDTTEKRMQSEFDENETPRLSSVTHLSFPAEQTTKQV